jgi:hypothetical protein
LVIKCNLADYYDAGIRIKDALNILAGILNNEQAIILKLEKPEKNWEKMLFINMSSIGFVEGRPENPLVTPRGFSFLCGRILLANKIIADNAVESMVAKLGLLKAIADVDWECFTRMIWSEDVDGLSWKELWDRDYPYDTERNFKHRRALHRIISMETGFSEVLAKSQPKEFNQIEVWNPYNSHFNAEGLFSRKIKSPNKRVLTESLDKALAIYSKLFKEHRPFGFSELLKSVIVAILLENGYYYSEPNLCEFYIGELHRRKITLFRSSRPLKITGRGFFIRREADFVFYPSFKV